MAANLKEIVFVGLDNCKENGYDEMLAGSADDIALDILAYNSEVFEEFTFKGEEPSVMELIPIIEDWKRENGLEP